MSQSRVGKFISVRKFWKEESCWELDVFETDSPALRSTLKN